MAVKKFLDFKGDRGRIFMRRPMGELIPLHKIWLKEPPVPTQNRIIKGIDLY